MRKKLLSMLLAWMVSIAAVWCQTRQITGIVTAGKDPVTGASIQLKDTKIGTVTDENGRYVLSVPNESSIIIIKGIGLRTQEVSIAGLSEINVKMIAENVDLGEIVVTAFGIERERKTLGYSQQRIGGEELRKSGEQNMIQGLAGKAAGVLVTGSGGSPGSSSKVLLRGNSTFTGNNQPLLVIDGVPMDNSTDQTTAGDYPFNSNLNGVNSSNRGVDINPDDIESMNILKGPAAAALYGVRAGAGAIIITTKKGKRGTKSFSVDVGTSFEISQVNKLPNLQMKYSQGNGGGVLSADKQSSIGAGKYKPGTTPESWGNLTRDSLGISPTDNMANFFKKGYTQNYNVSITNNTENSSVRFSVGRMSQTGTIPNTTFERTNMRLSLDTRLTPKMVFGGTVNYTNSGGTRAQNGSNLSGVMLGLLRTSNSFNLNDASKGGYLNPNGSQRQFFSIYDNPYWTVNQNPFRDDVNRILGNMNFTYDPIEWMSVTYRLGTDVYTDQRKQIFAIGSWAPSNAPGGQIEENTIRHQEVYSDLLVTFKKEINKDFKGTLLLGNNLNHRYNQDIYARGRDLGTTGNYNLNNAANLYASENNSTIRTMAYFFDLNLAFKNFLFLGVTGRQEYASTFGQAKNHFFYPSTSLSFVFSELIKIPKMSFGKIRIAYAEAGISPGPYNSRTYFSRATYTDGFTDGLSFPYLGSNGYGYAAGIGNAALKPERNTGKEIGLDVRFFDNRFGIDFTYYNQVSTDLLVSRPISPSTGFTSFYSNAGSMVNKGIELVVTGTPIKTKDFSWDININYTRNRNMVLSLADGVDQINIESAFDNIGSYAIKDQPYGVFYGTKWTRNSNGQLLIGANGLPLVDAKQQNVGSPYPKWYGGIRNTFTYKGFILSFLFDTRVGSSAWNGTWARLSRLGQTNESSDDREKSYIISGKKQSGVDANNNPVYEADNDIRISAYSYFRTYKGDGGNFAVENAIQDAGWIRLRDLNINYRFTMTPKLARHIKFVELGVLCRNLWLYTKYTGVDPETSLTGASSNIGGFDYFNNPGTKSYTFSLKASF
ncbi:MAG: SusC/RagA family TonB-linked outer membrane protein [Bacteroidia bacterium]|nr:SusC/RagA family TonB-linked outer membrane protein [Bacteroidia bacterium]